MKTIKLALLCILSFPITLVWAQRLKPGFDKEEYRELIYVATRSTEGPEKAALIPKPTSFTLAYESPSMGLDNQWELWTNNQETAVICIRGTTLAAESWLANLYAAMVPAKGELRLSNTNTFQYELSSHPRAAVHIGYLISTAFLAEDILPKIDSLYQSGLKDILIMGHSQGGAINYLMTSHLYSLQKSGRLPADIRFKTYCSAAPKPGNLYFAYEYEAMTQNGWAFNVVNAADWVPQTPFSVQMLEDLNEVNPLPLIQESIQGLKFPKKQVMKILFNKVSKPSQNTVKSYQKLLGKEMGKRVNKYLKDFDPPAYFNSSDYVRTGTTIVLIGDDAYYKAFPNDSKDFFIHHSFPPYLYLLERLTP